LKQYHICRLVVDFIDSMLRESASRAVAREPPLSFRESKERWTESIEKRAAFMQKPGGRQDAQRQNNNHNNGGKGAAGRGRGAASSLPRGGSIMKGRGAKFQGHSVCYHFNRAGGCNRTKKGSGCDNGNGGEYAHVCNHETSPGVYCLAHHSRVTAH
jgi:hypothetical protein